MDHRLPYLANCSILFTEVPLLERPAAARAAGFDAVEFWWPFATAAPPDAEVAGFVRAIRDAGVQLVGLNLAAGDMPAGERGLVSWPGREQELADSVAVAVGIAAELGTSVFNALYGLRLDGVPPQEQDELALANLHHAAQAASAVGARVLLEPVSGAPRYPLRTAADVVGVLDQLDVRVDLLLDVYHLSVNGDHVGAAIDAHADRIGHVQIADAPGRHEPGSGALDLDSHLQHLERAGYDGWVGLEYSPGDSTEAGLEWLPRERRAAPVTSGGGSE